MNYNQHKKIPLEQILVENSTYANTHRVKKRLIDEGMIDNVCACCGQTSTWNGRELSLQLHHINGKNNDHRLENLMLLCPNCHSQTDTYAGKKNKKEKPVKVKVEKVKAVRVRKPETKKLCQCGAKIKLGSKYCPTCYSKNRRTVERPSKDVLLAQINELGYVGTSKLYGVTDNSIRKWLKNMGA